MSNKTKKMKKKNNREVKLKKIENQKQKKKTSIIEWILILLLGCSFSALSFFQLVHYEDIFIILTIILSFIFSLLFIKNTFKENYEYIKNNPKKSILILLLSIIVVLAIHKSKAIPNKDLLVLSLPIKIFRLRWCLFTIPSIFYLFIWLFQKIKKFIIEFWSELDDKDKKIYLYVTLISSALILIIYCINDQWYQQYDLVYSIDSGWIHRNILPNLAYYDIRHPILSIITFPIWSISSFILKVFIPSQLLTGTCAAFIQIINIQLLLMIGFMIKKLTDNKWTFWLYLTSSPVLLFSIFLEKYQLCTFLLVLYVFLCLKNKKSNETNLIIATGVMPTSIFIYIYEIFVKEKIIDKIKRIFNLAIKGFGILICTGRIHLLYPKMLFDELTHMTSTFGLQDLSIKECLISFSNMIQGSFIGLSSIVTSKYEWSNILNDISLIGIIIFVIVIIGIFLNRKDKFVKICSVWTLVSLALLTVFKWSVHESPLFSIYFSWALIPLFQKGLAFIIKKMDWKENIIYYSILVPMIIINVLNIIDIAIFFN